MASKKKRLFWRWSISIGIIGLVLLVIWGRALVEITGNWFSDNIVPIFITTSILVAIFLIFGWIKIRSVIKKGKGIL